MTKAYEIVKENKLMIDCKNGDLIQFGKHLHIILLPQMVEIIVLNNPKQWFTLTKQAI